MCLKLRLSGMGVSGCESVKEALIEPSELDRLRQRMLFIEPCVLGLHVDGLLKAASSASSKRSGGEDLNSDMADGLGLILIGSENASRFPLSEDGDECVLLCPLAGREARVGRGGVFAKSATSASGCNDKSGNSIPMTLW